MSTLLRRGRRGEALTDIEIIDLHGHFGRYTFPIPDTTAAGLVAAMDRMGIRCIACSHMTCMSSDVERGHHELLAAMRAFPGRILGYVSPWPSAPAEVADTVERWLDAGFTGVKLHNANGFPYTDAAYAPAFALAHARRLPVLFHTWGFDHEFTELRELSRRYPEATLIMAHAGVANADAYCRIARECANVYIDPTLSSAPRGMIERLVHGAGAEKVVFGSDAYFFSQAQQLGRMLGAQLSEEEKAQVLSGNARRILARGRYAAAHPFGGTA